MTMLSIEPQHSNEHWAHIAGHAPILAATCQDYVAQISVTDATIDDRQRSIGACGSSPSWLTDHDPTVIVFRQINRRHIEQFKLWLATRENQQRPAAEEVNDQSTAFRCCAS